MSLTRMVRLKCEFSRTGFSGERGVQLPNLPYAGIAPVDYCRLQNGNLFTEEVPKRGERVPGSVQVRFSEQPNGTIVVAFPDGETVESNKATLDPLIFE